MILTFIPFIVTIIKCPSCGARYTVEDESSSDSIRCSQCNDVFILEDAEEF